MTTSSQATQAAGTQPVEQFEHGIGLAGVALIEVHALFLRQFLEDWFIRIAGSHRDLHAVLGKESGATCTHSGPPTYDQSHFPFAHCSTALV